MLSKDIFNPLQSLPKLKEKLNVFQKENKEYSTLKILSVILVTSFVVRILELKVSVPEFEYRIIASTDYKSEQNQSKYNTKYKIWSKKYLNQFVRCSSAPQWFR